MAVLPSPMAAVVLLSPKICPAWLSSPMTVMVSKNDASVFYLGASALFADDTNGWRDINSNSITDGLFDIGDQLQVDNATPGPAETGNNATGTLNYSAPDGGVVVAHLAFDKRTGGCALTGIATGG